LIVACEVGCANFTKGEIADRAEQVIRGVEFIESEQVNTQTKLDNDPRPITGGTEPLLVKSYMAKGHLRSEFYNDDGELIMRTSLVDGLYEEHVPGRPVVTYKSPFVNGTNSLQIRIPQCCRFGGDIFSWVVSPQNDLHVSMDRARTMRQKIDRGVQLPDPGVENDNQVQVYGMDTGVDSPDFKLKDGKNFVFFQDVTGDGAIYNVVEVDRNTFQIVRWDTGQPGVLRGRTYKIRTLSEVPTDFAWRGDSETTTTAQK